MVTPLRMEVAMHPLNLLVAQSDTQSSQALAARLRPLARSVAVAERDENLRFAIARHRVDLAVLDLDSVPLQEVQRLHQEFPSLAIVCTHRLADEAMWAAALSAGAIDCCHSSDVNGILLAARRNVPLAHGNAA
jgi:DNA-binding NarL/FixJ family response regulator